MFQKKPGCPTAIREWNEDRTGQHKKTGEIGLDLFRKNHGRGHIAPESSDGLCMIELQNLRMEMPGFAVHEEYHSIGDQAVFHSLRSNGGREKADA